MGRGGGVSQRGSEQEIKMTDDVNLKEVLKFRRPTLQRKTTIIIIIIIIIFTLAEIA